MRRVFLRGHPNSLKRLLLQVCGTNLGLLMRQLTGVGTPRSLQGRAVALVAVLIGLLSASWGRVRPPGPRSSQMRRIHRVATPHPVNMTT